MAKLTMAVLEQQLEALRVDREKLSTKVLSLESTIKSLEERLDAVSYLHKEACALYAQSCRTSGRTTSESEVATASDDWLSLYQSPSRPSHYPNGVAGITRDCYYAYKNFVRAAQRSEGKTSFTFKPFEQWRDIWLDRLMSVAPAAQATSESEVEDEQIPLSEAEGDGLQPCPF